MVAEGGARALKLVDERDEALHGDPRRKPYAAGALGAVDC